ncbi:FecR family protein [Sphingobacterium paucimobilis]|uniref:FecR protein domain-containing protein n=1 Tax=Sphingobacterium paucimobilis HER1398 TaxID=1346330 RepID=U2HRP1_9SPHI|nr:FecR domain-containing protein [Sphingobacterium paucimobilis]ERJ57955.1 hypothetical protein M472_04165 [Sphingobacterium paucimobilis HER1398]
MPLSEKNKNIFKAYFKGFESKEEWSDLSSWFDAEEEGLSADPVQQEQSGSRIRSRLLANIEKDKSPLRRMYMRPAMQVAAGIAVVFSAAWGYLHYTTNYVFRELDGGTIAQIKPIKDSVKLTFEDGKVVFLSTDSGVNQAVGEAQRIVDGELIYNSSSDRIVNNVVSTPKGNIFRISLPDGTKVWMNAKSVLSFPSRFVGEERQVHLQGEAYFEVAKDDKQPFVVTFADQKVRVLGTHFNISAYDAAVQRTTLMEGRVQVEKGSETVSLLPNEQVVALGSKMVKKSVEAAEYMAWKDGSFVFHNATPNEIMQQLALWYDLQIKSDESGAKERFSGKISKEMDLAKVLEVLAVADIHFKISENKLKHKEIERRK